MKSTLEWVYVLWTWNRVADKREPEWHQSGDEGAVLVSTTQDSRVLPLRKHPWMTLVIERAIESKC
jgi:hypothetical protein